MTDHHPFKSPAAYHRARDAARRKFLERLAVVRLKLDHELIGPAEAAALRRQARDQLTFALAALLQEVRAVDRLRHPSRSSADPPTTT